MTITKAQLKAMLDYMDMFGTEAFHFDIETIEATFDGFKPIQVDPQFEEPQGRSISFKDGVQ